MVSIIKVILLIIKEKVKEYYIIKIVRLYMKVILKMINIMVMENFIMMMEVTMKGNLLITNGMEKEYYTMKKNKLYLKAISKMMNMKKKRMKKKIIINYLKIKKMKRNLIIGLTNF